MYGSCNFQRWLVTISPYNLIITWYSFLIALTKRVQWSWHYRHLMLGLKQWDRFYPALSLSLCLSQDAYFWNSGSMPYGSPNHMDRPHEDILVNSLSWGPAYWSALTTGHGWGNLKGDFNPSHCDRHHIKEPSENRLAEAGQRLELRCVRACSVTSAVTNSLRPCGL